MNSNNKNCEVIRKCQKNIRCVDCKKTFLSMAQLTSHRNVVHLKLKPFKCDLCLRTFAKTKELQDHIRRHHTKEKPYKCTHPNCEKDFVSYSDIKSHKIIHLFKEEREKFYCSYSECGKIFAKKFSLKQHIDHIHLERGHKCGFEGCGKSFATNSNLRTHLKLHSSVRPFKCSYCAMAFKLKISLDSHMKKKHINPHLRPYACSVCSKAFKSKCEVKQHTELHEKHRKIFQCTLCPAKRTSKSNLTAHIKFTHNGKTFKCPYCHKLLSFSSKSSHIKLHSTTKLWKCYFCGSGLKSYSNLQRHYLTHTKERPNKCFECSKRFLHQPYLKNHVETVHLNCGKARFSCSSCPKLYNTSNGLRDHYNRIHKHILKSECPLCNQKFRNGFTLNQHITSFHTKEKPFSCGQCTYATSRTSQLKRHKLSHK